MTREKIDIIFNLDWNQIGELYSTCDDRVFINKHDAELHALGLLDEPSIPLYSNKIDVWFRYYKDLDLYI